MKHISSPTPVQLVINRASEDLSSYMHLVLFSIEEQLEIKYSGIIWLSIGGRWPQMLRLVESCAQSTIKY